MDYLTQEQQTLPLWKLFFIFSGFISIILWNFILNLIFYFDTLVHRYFSLFIILSCSLANITCLVSYKFLLRSFSTSRKLFISAVISSLLFNVLGIFLETVSKPLPKQITSILLAFWISYFAAFFQLKVSEFASACGPFSIKYFNIGTGFSGFSSNLFAIFFTLFAPTSHVKLLSKNLSAQMVCFLLFVNSVYLAYLFISYNFMRRYGHFVSSLDYKESADSGNSGLISTTLNSNLDLFSKKVNDEQSTSFTSNQAPAIEPSYSWGSVLRRIIDIWFAVLFTYTITLETVCFVIPYLTRKLDHNKELFILIYLLLYHLGDTIGKVIPSKLHFRSSSKMHCFVLVRGLVRIYLMWAVFGTLPPVLSNYFFEGGVYLLVGISNGYICNNAFELSSNRFQNSLNKKKSDSSILYAIIFGVALGSLFGILAIV